MMEITFRDFLKINTAQNKTFNHFFNASLRRMFVDNTSTIKLAIKNNEIKTSIFFSKAKSLCNIIFILGKG